MKVKNWFLIVVLMVGMVVYGLGGALPSTAAFTRDLSLGAQGPDVTDLQRLLASKSYAISATGIYDSATEKAVQRFQAASGINIIAERGAVKAKTREFLNAFQETRDYGAFNGAVFEAKAAYEKNKNATTLRILQNVLKARRETLKQLAVVNPTKLQEVKFAKNRRDTFPEEVKNLIETEQTVEGVAEVSYEEYPDLNLAISKYTLLSQNIRYQLEGEKKELSPGARVRGQAIVVDTVVFFPVAPQVISRGPEGGALGSTGITQENVAVILMNFPGRKVSTETKAEVQGWMDTVKNYVREVSGGKVSAQFQVFGWYTASQPLETFNCGPTNLAKEAIRVSGINEQQFTRVMVFISKDHCSWGGVASINGKYSAVANGGWSTAAHELFHNFGLNHAAFMDCQGVVIRPRPFEECHFEEYGDRLEVMGSGLGQLHAYHKDKLGYFFAGQVKEVTQTGEYFVEPLAQASVSGVRALKIPRGNGTNLWVEFRERIGFDAWLSSADIDGIFIHLDGGNGNGMDSYLIDGSPSTSASPDSTVFRANQAYTDSYGRIKIIPLGKSGSAYRVRVEIGDSSPLMAAYSFDEASGSTVITDEASQLFDGVWKGPAAPIRTAGVKNSALLFNGAGDSVAASDIGVAADFTIALWVKSADLAQFERYILLFGEGNQGVLYGHKGPNGGGSHVEFFSRLFQGQDPRPGSSIKILDTNWHHIVYSYNSTTGDWRGYLDGKQIFQAIRRFTFLPGQGLVMGARDSKFDFFHGELDELKIFRTALSPQEVQALYNEVSASPAITLLSPNGRERMYKGIPQKISWKQERVPKDAWHAVYITHPSVNNGTPTLIFQNCCSAPTSSLVEISTSFAKNLPSSVFYKVEVRLYTGSPSCFNGCAAGTGTPLRLWASDTSDANFSLSDPRR